MQQLILLIREALHLDVAVGEDTPLLSSGLVDSFGLVVLLGAIEEQYDVVVDESALGVDNFDSPRQILETIRITAVER